MAAKKSITSNTKAKTRDQNSERQWHEDKAAGGAAWAKKFIELARGKPTEYALQGWIDDAETLFHGNKDEIYAFYDTLQAVLVKAAPTKLTTGDIEQIGSDVGRVSSLIYSMLHVSRNMDAEESASIEALCEKAGTIADRCAVALGDIPACGSWPAWAGLERLAPDAPAEVQEAHHG